MSKWFPPFFHQQFHLKSGVVASNGWLEVFLHGTTTHAPIFNYNDVEQANPIPLNNYGRCQIKVSDQYTYDFKLYDENLALDDFIEGVSIPISSGEPGTLNHDELLNRDSGDQHPITAITSLDTELSDKVSKSETSDQTIKSSLIVDGNPSDGAFIKMFGNYSTGATRMDVNGASGYVQIIGSATGDPWVKVFNQTTGAKAYVYPEEVSVSNFEGTKASRLDINGLTLGGQSKITFDTTPDAATLNEGVAQWNSDDSTLSLGMGGGVVQSIGAELPHKAKNVSGSQFVDGQIGYIFGASGQRISMKKPTASDITAIKALFMATQTLADNNTGFFNALGVVHGVDTHLFAEGAEVWLDTTAGAITATAPAKPNYQARMGYVVVSHASNGSIFFHPDIQPKIGDLSDCNTSIAVQGDFLTKGSDGVYKPNVFYDDWRWGGYARATGATPATFADINSTGIYAWEFTNGKSLHYPELQIPHDYKEGTDIIPHVHFCTRTTGTYTGTWTFEYVDWLEISSGNAMQTKKTTTISFNQTMTAFQSQTADFTTLISGTGRKISSIMHGKLTLTLSAGASIFLMGIDGHYQKDRFGSNTATAK